MSQNDIRELSKLFQIQFSVFYNKECVYSQVGSANQDRRNTCIYVIIGALQALCMVFLKRTNCERVLYLRSKVWVWLTLNRDWHGCVYCYYIIFPASINASGIDQHMINPWIWKAALSTSSYIFIAEDVLNNYSTN